MRRVLAALAALTIAAAGCGGKANLSGDWKAVDPKSVAFQGVDELRFIDDSHVSIASGETFKYEVLNGDTLSIDFPDQARSAEFKREGDVLTLTVAGTSSAYRLAGG